MAMAMAMSSSPSPLSWSPSSSFNFLYPNPQNGSLKIFTFSRFKLLCSHQTVQFDTQQTNPTKKKRKPRPSFLEQIEDKWSVKTTSLRQKFPWEEEQEKKETLEEEKEVENTKNDEIDGNESRIGKNSLVSDSVSVGVVNNRVKFAPWDQRSKFKKPQIEFEAKNVESSSGRVTESRTDKNSLVSDSMSGGYVSKQAKFAPWNQKSKFGNPQIDYEALNGESSNLGVKWVDEFPQGYVLESNNLEKNFGEDDSFEEIDDDCGEVDAISGGVLLEKNERNFVKHDAKLTFEGKLLSNGEQEVGICEDSRDEQMSTEDKLWKMMPWEKSSEEESKRSNTMLAEKLIPEPELKRLRNVALRMVERFKVGAAGITQALVDSIHEKWKVDEVVKLKFEGPTAANMKRSHEILERRTGGLVIWRSGSSIVLFRGMAYNLQCVKSYTKHNQPDVMVSQPPNEFENKTRNVTQGGSSSSLKSSTSNSASYMKGLSEGENMDLSELNFLLDEIGPRYVDWAGPDPLPVDADLLPNVVLGYKRPFRLLPYGTRPVLRDREMTFIRRAAKTMPPHFALGRNRELQGLAKAMAKLWEKSAIAKIAIKRGVHNTRNERMAEELKILTGGTLVSRNKDYIVFYRGNDFLPPDVTETLVKAQNLTATQQDVEDEARQRAFMESKIKVPKGPPLVAGTLAETMAATSRWGNQPSDEEREKMMKDLALARHASLVRFLEKKLSLANTKVKKAEKALRKVQEYLEPSSLPIDLETLSDEERFLFRKIGLSMKPFLLLGTRGIFDGTIENMHLHWKYRELVKIIFGGKRFPQVKHIAIALEAESGGVLVSVDKTTKGYAIIVYRGKNYKRPRPVRPKNLLTRRQALARSIELQRREALKHHIKELQGKIKKLKLELEDMTTVNKIDEDTFYSRVNNASDSDEDDDEDSMEEGEDEEAYLQTYDSGDEDGNNSPERPSSNDENKERMHAHRHT